MILEQEVVGIIMPVFNSENSIERAILSVINQTHIQWKLYIIDDASTDRTKDLIDKFLHDRRIIYIKKWE